MKKGYTLVELLVVIVIIGVLTSIAFVGFGKIQADARDKERASNATIIAEALEKYYDKNGEYPSVPAVTNTNVSQVKSLLGIADTDVFVMPKAASGVNSVVSNTDPAIDKLVYDAESVNSSEDTSCKNTPMAMIAGCDEFTLSWKTESNDQEEINSRHSGREIISEISALEAPSTPVMSAALSGSNVVGTISTLSTCSEGIVEYKIRTWTNSNTPPEWSTISNWSTDLSRSISSPTTSTYYRFQSIAHCNLNGRFSDESGESNIASYYSAAPSSDTPTLTSTDNGTTFTATATVSGTCAGTRYYSIQLRTNSGVWTTDSWLTSNTRSQTMTSSPSVSYEFQAKARCTATGTISGTSNIETAVSAPPAPIITSPSATTSGSSNSVTWGWNAVACPINFTAQYLSYTTSNKGASYGSASGWSTTRTRAVDTSSQGYGYGVVAQARCTNSQATSLVSSNSTLRIYNRDISVNIWVYTGTIHTFRPNSDASPTYVIGRAKVKTSKRSEGGSTSATCDTGSATTSGLKRQINFTWDSDEGGSNRQGWSGWQEWPGGELVFRGDYGGSDGNGDLDDNQTFEAIFSTRCARYSGTTVLNAGDSNESDNFGNIRVVNSTGKAHTLCDQNRPAPYCQGNGTGYNEEGTSTGTCTIVNGSHKYCFSELFNANTAVWGW